MLKKYGLLLLAGSIALLPGCTTPPPPPPPPPLDNQSLALQIKSAGMEIVQFGDRLIIVIPTDLYFKPKTTLVKEEEQLALQGMAQFVKHFANQYPNSVIKVTGYTDRVFSHRTQLDLSQSYAEAISVYLFDAGIDRGRIATQGRGNQETIAGEFEPKSAAFNRRVTVQVN
jgi:outer membrane protein OmpA-like peptidoglycan-associated protein